MPFHPVFAGAWRAATAAITLWLFGSCAVLAQYPSTFQISKDGTAILLTNYASLPLSSRTVTTYPPAINLADQLARGSFLRSEPADAPLSVSRFFVSDLNRNLYILNKAGRSFTTYINFEEVFRRFDNKAGYAGGLVSFIFDPAYATNGIFYTVHTEDPASTNSLTPINTSLPGLDTNGYTTTAVFNPPAGSNFLRQAVLVEWTDTNINNTTFEGTAREILRIGFNDIIHPMGDLIFNPLAQPGDPDYRNLYIANGDGSAGETPGSEHPTPQRLDVLQGKILRITPDTTLRPADDLSSNGRYRIPTTGPDPNPFVSITLNGLKKEIYAYGFRNPHRLSWDPDSNRLIVDDIGLNSWEEVNIVTKGGNYGYAEREGAEQLFVGGANNGLTGSRASPKVPFPASDALMVTGLVAAVTPIYPVAAFSHQDGNAISSGFVYRGNLMPALRGKYLFGDIVTGRIYYCNLSDMIAAAASGVRTNQAAIHEIQMVDNGMARRLFDLEAQQYRLKGGTATGEVEPGGCGGLATSGNDPDGVPWGCGRSDFRIAQGGDGEFYLLTKADGMIRQMIAAVVPPTISTATVNSDKLGLSWLSISNRTYRVQVSDALTGTNWLNLSADIKATNGNTSASDTLTNDTRFYRLQILP